MSNSKKIFLLVAVVFLILLIFFSYDVSKRTTFPQKKSADTVNGIKTVDDTLPGN